MRRLFCAFLAATIVGLAITTALALGSTVPNDRATLTSAACRRALDASRRMVSITSVMRPLPGTARMGMRFQLFGLNAGQVVTVHGGDLGTWLTPHPPTLGQLPNDVWIVHHPVSGVPVPGLYHFRVSFRWIGSDGQTLGTTVRTAPNCWQPDMRPELNVDSLTVQPVSGNPAEDTYSAEVSNMGMTTANAVEVQFTPVSGTAQLVTVPRLLPHEQNVVVFTGFACSAATGAPTVAIDPQHRISQKPGGTASLTATCPAPTSSTSSSAASGATTFGG